MLIPIRAIGITKNRIKSKFFFIIINKGLLPLIRKQGGFYCKREYKPNIWVALAIIVNNLPELTLDKQILKLDFKTTYANFKNIFGLEYRTLEDILHKLQEMGVIKHTEFGIEILCNYTFMECIKKAYQELEV